MFKHDAQSTHPMRQGSPAARPRSSLPTATFETQKVQNQAVKMHLSTFLNRSSATSPKAIIPATTDCSRTHAGVWSVKLEQGARVVLLRSLLWPGFFSYHAPAQAQYGWFYIGTGQKNMDIGYML